MTKVNTLMKKIIHLSDLHIGYQDCSEKFSNLIELIKLNYRPAINYVIVITGDIVENAQQKWAYEEAVALLKRFEDANYTVLVVPGNHDYGNGIKGNERYVSLFKQTFYNDPNISYPKLDIVEDIAFIGLDSMAATFDWFDVWGADGELGKKQIADLDKLLSNTDLINKKKVVYLHHHPFDGRGFLHMLKDYQQFKQVIEGRVDCLLFGHNHEGNRYPNKWGIPQCYDGSSSTGKADDQHGITRVRLISL